MLPLILAAAIVAPAGFTPPASWPVVRAPLRNQRVTVIGAWREPGGASGAQNVILTTEPFSGTARAYLAAARDALFKGPALMQVIDEGDLMCTHGRARLFAFRTDAFGRPLIYTQIARIIGGHAYLATYTRPAGEGALNDAQLSILSLCPGAAHT